MRRKLKVIIPIIMAAIMLFVGGALFINSRAINKVSPNMYFTDNLGNSATPDSLEKAQSTSTSTPISTPTSTEIPTSIPTTAPINITSISSNDVNKDIREVKVGDYIEYIPTKKLYSVDSSQTGDFSNQTFNPSETTSWIVFNNDDEIEIISEGSIGNLTLKGATGYKNAVAVLDDLSKEYINSDYATDARSVGSTSNSISRLTSELEYGKYEPNYEDNNYSYDLDKIRQYKDLSNNSSIWLASRKFEKDENWNKYFIRSLMSVGEFDDSNLYSISQYGTEQETAYTRGIRVIVELKNDIEIVSGTGTKTDPYILSIEKKPIVGDVNEDGKISNKDATYVLQYVAGTRELTENQRKLADVNLDNKVDDFDGQLILAANAGTIELPTNIICGDVSEDGVLNALDALIVQQYVGGETTLTSKQKLAADVNLDNKIDEFDTKCILEASAGKIVVPCKLIETKEKSIVEFTWGTQGTLNKYIYIVAEGNISVDWGDGSKDKKSYEVAEDITLEHKYTVQGNYNVKIVSDKITELYFPVYSIDFGCEVNKLDVSKATELTKLICADNKLTTLDLSKNTALIELDCSANKLTTLDLSKNVSLKELKCGVNELQLDVSKNKLLEDLDCSNSNLNSLDLSNNMSLVKLNCDNSQLKELDISKNLSLKELNCYNNRLSSLDVSNNTKLEYLSCSYNRLTGLDVSKNINLEELYCSQETMKELIMDKKATTKVDKYEGTKIVYVGEDLQEIIEKLVALKVMNLYEDGSFKPENTMTRAEMVVVLCKMVGIDEVVCSEKQKVPSRFSDVKSGEWYTGYINVADSKGLLTNLPNNGAFRPNDAVTLNEVLTLCVNALGRGEYVSTMGVWPANYIAEATKLDLLKGVRTSEANRGNIARIVWNTLEAPYVWDAASADYSTTVSLGDSGKSLLSIYFEGPYIKDEEDVSWQFGILKAVAVSEEDNETDGIYYMRTKILLPDGTVSNQYKFMYDKAKNPENEITWEIAVDNLHGKPIIFKADKNGLIKYNDYAEVKIDNLSNVTNGKYLAAEVNANNLLDEDRLRIEANDKVKYIFGEESVIFNTGNGEDPSVSKKFDILNNNGKIKVNAIILHEKDSKAISYILIDAKRKEIVESNVSYAIVENDDYKEKIETTVKKYVDLILANESKAQTYETVALDKDYVKDMGDMLVECKFNESKLEEAALLIDIPEFKRLKATDKVTNEIKSGNGTKLAVNFETGKYVKDNFKVIDTNRLSLIYVDGDSDGLEDTFGEVVIDKNVVVYDTRIGIVETTYEALRTEVENSGEVYVVPYIYKYPEWYGTENFEANVLFIVGSKSIIISVIPEEPQQYNFASYKDIKSGDWYYDSGVVKFVTEKGYINGLSDKEFGPDLPMTREQFMSMLYNMAGKPAVTGNNSFKDVKARHNVDAIVWGNQVGLMSGYPDKTFRPDASIDREQVVTVLKKYAEYIGLNTSARANLTTFNDYADIYDWAYDAVSWAIAKGIMRGDNYNRILPHKSATRAEVAAILKNFETVK